MDLNEVMLCAPTTRRFLPDPVEGEVLRRVLDNARFAPSGGNRQGWRVVAVTDADTRRALGALYLPHWRTYVEAMGIGELLANPREDEDSRIRAVRLADEFAKRLHEVPLHLVVCVRVADLAIVDQTLDRPSIVGGASVYPFVQNVLLGLRNEGLGASLTTLLAPAEPQVKELLAIPDDVVLAAYVLVGRRADPWPTRLSRKPLEQIAFSERYGQPLTQARPV
jgi:nitroreductase